jgi:SPP1 gp7 family putative phage head morphogenesis protein
MAQPEPQEVLQAYVRIQKAADAEILRALRDAYRDVNRRLGQMSRAGAGDLERSRALAIKKAILDAQAELFERTGKVVERRRVEAAARAIQVAGRYDEAAFAAVGRERDARAVAEGLEATEARAIDAVEARLSGASRQPLSERVYRAQAWSSGVLERRVNSALARGLNAQEFAREVRDLVNPNTPGGPRYAALRLARTEINNAYHAMAVAAAQAKPWITKVEWHTSKSHARRDICDELNGRMFAPTEVPLKPHPQCLCYITSVIDEDDDAFLDALVDGDFDEFIDKFAERQGIDLTPESAISGAAAPILATPTEIAPALPEVTQSPALSGAAALDSVRTGLIRRGSLTPKQRKAWREYESSFFVFINNYLRRGRKDVDGKQDARTDGIIAQMDPTFQPLGQDVDVFRGIFRARRLFGGSLDGDLGGFEWTEDGYSSTSVDEQMSREFALSADSADDERIVMRTRVSRGIGASAVSDTRAKGGQGEIALQRGVQWKIIRDLGTDPTGVRYLEAEVTLP